MVVNPKSNLQHGEVFLVDCPQLPSYLQTVTSNRNQSTRYAVVTIDQLEMVLGYHSSKKLTQSDQWYQHDVLEIYNLIKTYLYLQMHVYWTPN